MSYYIYNKQGKHEGPYEEEQLRSMLEAGRLDKEELVSQNGLSSWSPIHLVQEEGLPAHSSCQEEKKYRLLAQDGVQTGPFDISTLRDMLRQGKAQPSDYIWTEGMDNWESIHHLIKNTDGTDFRANSAFPPPPASIHNFDVEEVDKKAKKGLGWFMMAYVIASKFSIQGEIKGNDTMSVVGGGLLLGLMIYVIMKLYEAWKYIQPLSCLIPSRDPMPSPQKAIGFLFIPIFNFYWAFTAWPGLLERAQKMADSLSMKNISFHPKYALGYVIAVIIDVLFALFIPYQPLWLSYAIGIPEAILLYYTFVEIRKVIVVFGENDSSMK